MQNILLMLKRVIKYFTPPIVFALKHKLSNRGNVNHFRGDFLTWDEAKIQTEGYDSKRLLHKIIDANRKVKLDSNKFERDSIIFSTPQLLPSLNSYLLLAYALHKSSSNFTVLDFGGSLGTVYRQFKYFTKGSIKIKWVIVEQTEIVNVGNDEFKNDELSFLDTNSWKPSQLNVDLIIVSSVLEFCEEPEKIINEFKNTNAKYLILDRTPVWGAGRNVLTICTAAKYISGSYPCWIFSEPKIKHLLTQHWEIIGEWDALGSDIVFSRGKAKYKGQCWKKRSTT